MTFIVAIAGRPNVGKSTLFNRLVGKRLALVSDMPGLTRDRREAEVEIGDLFVKLVDTAGLEDAPDGSIASRMREQSERAVREADCVVFVIDARAGVTPADQAFAAIVRATGKPVILAVNKSEGRSGETGFYDAFRLGLGEPLAISAEHGDGVPDLRIRIEDALVAPTEDGEPRESREEKEARNRPIKIAIVGRPNAGKSTLVNALLGDDRMITGPEAGLTRDSIASDYIWQGRAVKLYDTAGLRRKARIEADAEKLSASDAINAIKFAEVVIVLIDVEQPFDKQDLLLAQLTANEGRALVIAINKWDLVADKDAYTKALRETAEALLPQVRGVPVVTVSAIAARGLDQMMAAAFDMYENWNRRIGTAGLNRWFGDMIEKHTPPAIGGKRIKLRYMTQANARPPTFIAFCSRPDDLPESYVRYLTNSLREHFDMGGVPIRFHLRKRENPYAPAMGARTGVKAGARRGEKPDDPRKSNAANATKRSRRARMKPVGAKPGPK
ncbi:MAG: ribosome biogenesis GTPase Der [Hyphomicrobiales bacterium]|nr:ribosome biogenesis GTPase Der [Hyphomicrobiales bacterium]